MSVDITDLRTLLDLRAEQLLVKKDAEAALEVLDAQIKERLGDHEEATVDGKPAVTWRWTESARLDQTLLKSRYPHIKAECTTTTRSRRFLVPYEPAGETAREQAEAGIDYASPDAGF